VGEENIRRRQQVSNVSAVTICGDTISSIPPGSCATAFHLVEIDLQNNLLWRWEDVSVLGLEVPGLGVLLLHGNRLQPITETVVASLNPSCFTRLRVLALNSCDIKSWGSVQLLEPFLDLLEELYLKGNALSDLPLSPLPMPQFDLQSDIAASTSTPTSAPTPTPNPTVLGFACLRLLDISDCGLTEWTQKAAFGGLRLQECILDDNPLPAVHPLLDGAFSCLVRFSLANTG
jgi:Leucine-rich repeat (LRR) protein